MNKHSVFKFTMFFGSVVDREERYVVAETEAEAIEKFKKYLHYRSEHGCAKPISYSHDPTVEIDYVIV